MSKLKSIIRTLARFKLYVSINIFGLVLGLSCFLVLMLYVVFQFSFDNFHTNGDRIYRVTEKATEPDGVSLNGGVRIPVGIDLKEHFVEIEDYVHVGVQNHEYYLKQNEDQISINKVLYVSDNFFEFFSFDLLLGTANEVLQNEQSVVITDHVAKKLFEGISPIGKAVILNDKTYIVSGVAKNPPINSHIQFDAVLSIKPVVNMFGAYIAWDGGLTVPTFVRIVKPELLGSLMEKIPALVWEKINKKQEGSGYFTEIGLEPLAKVHAKSNVAWDGFEKKDYTGLMSLALVGLLVLIVAFVNFIFLSKGILSLRYKEFGVKRYLGNSKGGVFMQLLYENNLIFGFVFFLSMLVILLTQNQINALFGMAFIIPLMLQYGILILFSVEVIAVLSAWFQFNYIQNKVFTSNNAYFFKTTEYSKNLWVTSVQFAATIVLLVVIFGIYKQLNYMALRDLGFKTNNVIYVSHDNIGANKEALINELQKVPGVSSLSASFGLPGIESTINGYLPQGMDQYQMFNALHVDDNFLEFYDIELSNGRAFKKGSDLDQDAFIVNETLVKKLGWENPIGKTIFRGTSFRVVGVVKDFHVASMYEQVPPLIISKQHAKHFYTLSISLNTNDLNQTIKQLELAWAKIMPNLPFNYQFLDSQFAKFYSEVRHTGQIMMLFSLISMLISITGLFAISILFLNNRVKEIGVRKVNGAKVLSLMYLLNRDFIIWVVLAIVIAIPIASLIMHKWLSQFAYRTTISWWLFALAGCIAMVIALVTVSWQTFKAARKNPIESLRYE